MHENPPYAAMEVIHLFGGPFDGEAWKVPMNTSEIQIPLDAAEEHLAHYHHDQHLTIHFKRPTFRSADLHPFE